jgi:nitrogen fixation protein NifU and related proteins
MDLNSIYQNIILETAKRHPNDDIMNPIVHLTNPTCGDDIKLQGSVFNHQLTNLKVNIQGCIICQAATTLMLEAIQHQDVDTMRDIILNMSKMMTHESFNEKQLGNLVALKTVVQLPIRIKCAMLPFKGLYQLIEEGDSHRRTN